MLNNFNDYYLLNHPFLNARRKQNIFRKEENKKRLEKSVSPNYSRLFGNNSINQNTINTRNKNIKEKRNNINNYNNYNNIVVNPNELMIENNENISKEIINILNKSNKNNSNFQNSKTNNTLKNISSFFIIVGKNIITESKQSKYHNNNQSSKDLSSNNNYSNRNNSNEKNNLKEGDFNNLNEIDQTISFLKDLSKENKSFIYLMKLIQTNVDLESLFNKIPSNEIINDEELIIVRVQIKRYFTILSSLNKYYDSNMKKVDRFFLFESINDIFYKSIKIQICLFTWILVTLSQFNKNEISRMIKNFFKELIKNVSNLLLNIFNHFIKNDINFKYEIQKNNNDLQIFKYNIDRNLNNQKINHNYKNSELITLISNNIDSSFNSIKSFFFFNLRHSGIKEFVYSYNQLLTDIEEKQINQLLIIILKVILFSELNKDKGNTTILNLDYFEGSSYFNNINKNEPFLPPIKTNYEYTLILNLDENLIYHFSNEYMRNGMFMVRPHCFEFLNELNKIYEIIIFTNSEKNYADDILNILDINNNIFKYRLYREHLDISNDQYYKDLNKLGRNLNKVIIIDNDNNNFRKQPNNGLLIKEWTYDINDTELVYLLKILKGVVMFKVNDVRKIIEKINKEIENKEKVLSYKDIIIENLINEY